MKKLIAINIMTFFVLVLAIETCSYYILKNNYYQPLFLWNNIGSNQKNIGKRNSQISETHISSIDPHLGYSWLSNEITIDKQDREYLSCIDGFTCYSENSTTGNLIKIVCLGGSTTDGSIKPYSWPESLFIKLREQGHSVKVYNGGISGYSSSQELLKLVRDVIILEPDIVISLSGVNDFGKLHSLDNHPMVNHYQANLMKYVYNQSNSNSIILPASRLLINEFKKRILEINEDKVNGISFGLKSDLSPYENWRKNIRLMNAICNEYEIKFYSFLQPTMGFGKYFPNKEETKMYQSMIDLAEIDYETSLNNFYKQATLFSQEQEYVHDLTDIFRNKNNVYRDPRHQNELGVKLIADAVYLKLEQRWDAIKEE